MTLQQLYEQTPPQQRALQFGVDGGDALTGAFPQKRVVHAGLQGSLVSPEESQKIWQDLMGQAPTGKEVQTAYIHIPFCKTKCLYCGFFQNGMDQSVEDEYIRCLVREMRQSPFHPFIDEIQYQLEQGYLDIGTLAAREPRLGELNWLYRRWQDQGLVRYNGVLYELTDAGQFWQVNLTQTTLECMQYLLTGRTAAALKGIAAQDSPESAAMAEAMRQLAGTDDSILHIANGVGYENSSKFAEAFKKTTGLLPKDYRKVAGRQHQ